MKVQADQFPMEQNPAKTADQLDDSPIRKAARRYAADLKKRHGMLLAREPGRVRAELVRALKIELPTSKGRPKDAAITMAVSMANEGIGYAQIAAMLYPEYARSDKQMKQYWRGKAIAAVSQRRRRDRQNKFESV